MFGEGSAINSVTPKADNIIAKLARSIGAESLLNKKTLTEMITYNYCFPSQHRIIIWRYLLQLPMNEDSYINFASQQMNPAIKNLQDTIPLRFTTLSNRLMRLISSLVYWHPPLAECDWLPGLVFPFLRIFERDSIITFETCVTIISNWCQEWLTFIPNPPITVLSRIERIVKANGGNASISIIWPPLRSFFGEVANSEAAIILFDNILASKPIFIEYLVAAYALLPGSRSVTEANVKHLIDNARKLYRRDHADGPKFSPLPKGFYPVFSIPKKSPRWREQELERIRSEAVAKREQEGLQNEIENETERIERQRRNWMAERAVLREIEEEQMEEFRRREKEILAQENAEEEANLQLRAERLRRRRLEEEAAIEQWRADCQRMQEEISRVSTGRRAIWARWTSLKDQNLTLAQEEMEDELEFLDLRSKVSQQELGKQNQMLENAMNEEQSLMQEALKHNENLEQQKVQMKKKLQEARDSYHSSISRYYRASAQIK